MCACQAMKDDPACRQMVNEAFEHDLHFLPVILEPGYNPDGWLEYHTSTIINVNASTMSKTIDLVSERLLKLRNASTG